MGLWANFSRRNGETLRQFWQRHSRIVASLQKSGAGLPSKIVCRKSLPAMKLSSSQISILLGTLESQHMEESLEDLKRRSVELFGRNFLEQDDRILKVEETEEDCASIPKSDNTLETIGEEQVETFLTDEGECFEIRKIPSPKKKGSRGEFANAISSSIRSYNLNNSNPNAANVNTLSVAGKSGANPKSNLECWRCGSTSHGWKQCHLPWQKTLAFGNAIKAKASSSSNVKWWIKLQWHCLL